MINISIDQEMYNNIIRAIKPLEKSEESVFKTAVNNTAKRAQKLLARQANKVYGGAAPPGILERSSIAKATVSNASVQIIFRSEQHDLTKFKTSAAGRGQTRTMYIGGSRVKFPISATQLKQGAMKPLEGSNGMAFCVTLGNGKTIIASHAPGRTKNGSGKIKALLGSSDKVMVQNDKVYGEVNDKIGEILQEQCQKALDKAMGGK